MSFPPYISTSGNDISGLSDEDVEKLLALVGGEQSIYCYEHDWEIKYLFTSKYEKCKKCGEERNL